MLFNSYVFIFLFFPVTLAGFYVVSRYSRARHGLAFLVVASLYFYSYWKFDYVFIILTSVLLNYAASRLIQSGEIPLPFAPVRFSKALKARRTVLILGIAGNLLVIGYFKYLFFISSSLDVVSHFAPGFFEVVLPIGISFYTFQQIMFLVDCYRDKYEDVKFLEYVFYISFFPQLIAGPIVQFADVRDQLSKIGRHFNSLDIEVGFTIFVFGLFKKVVIADSFAVYVDAGYTALSGGQELSPVSAWVVAIGYSFQLYFDFSGYSDMAIGLARLFGLRLPLNFFSPYKATSIIEFWRRWHITLSRFLRDYLYVPLGGSRVGPFRQVRNIIFVMFLGGLWHGANWTFVVWGMIHGALLVANHLWRKIVPLRRSDGGGWAFKAIAIPITFLLVTLAWVPFRAESMNSALTMYEYLVPRDWASIVAFFADVRTFVLFQFASPSAFFDIVHWSGLDATAGAVINPNTIASVYPVGLLLLAGALIVFFAPNVYELMRWCSPALGHQEFIDDQTSEGSRIWRRRRTFRVVSVGVLFAISLSAMQRISPFLYFQF